MHPLSVAGRTADDLNRMVVDGISEAVSVIRGALPLICEPVAADGIGQAIDLLDETVRQVRSGGADLITSGSRHRR